MAINNFIPAVWAARLLQNLHKAQVYTQTNVVNRDYTGQIQSMGDTVKINAIGAVSVSDYTKNVDMSAAETLSDAQTTLVINQAKYFNFQIDDVDTVQQTPKVMDEAMREAAYALADAADQYTAALYADASADNLIGSTASPKTDLGTASKAYDYLIDLGVLLDVSNTPRQGRFVIVPPWFQGVMAKDTSRFALATPQGEQRIANGVIGEAAGFTILVSNNVYNTALAKYRIIAGHPSAWTFAEQINKVEAYRPPLRFADAMKGLHLYGAKVVRPACLAVLTANKPS